MNCAKCDALLDNQELFYAKQGSLVCCNCVGTPDETTEVLSPLDFDIEDTCDLCPIALDPDLIGYSLTCLGAAGSERCKASLIKIIRDITKEINGIEQ